MALINCYECGKQVSDKASACPHCGAPMDEIDIMNYQTDKNIQESFTVEILGFANESAYKRYHLKASSYLSKIYGRYEDIKPCVLFKNISQSAVNFVFSHMGAMGCSLQARKTNEPLDAELDRRILDSAILKCPRCKSTSITTGQRGYSLLWGFLGSNKTVNRCGNCGYSWEP